MMWHVNAMNGWQLPYMIVYPLLVTAVLVLGVVWLVRSLRADPTSPAPTDIPLRILAERYARGELTDDEYRAGLSTLRES